MVFESNFPYGLDKLSSYNKKYEKYKLLLFIKKTMSLFGWSIFDLFRLLTQYSSLTTNQQINRTHQHKSRYIN
jgi:hypothetical protein